MRAEEKALFFAGTVDGKGDYTGNGFVYPLKASSREYVRQNAADASENMSIHGRPRKSETKQKGRRLLRRPGKTT